MDKVTGNLVVILFIFLCTVEKAFHENKGMLKILK